MSVSIFTQAEARLRQRAAARGKPLELYASTILEHVAAIQNLNDILAPVRQQFARTGMTADQLAELLEDLEQQSRTEQWTGGR